MSIHYVPTSVSAGTRTVELIAHELHHSVAVTRLRANLQQLGVLGPDARFAATVIENILLDMTRIRSYLERHAGDVEKAATEAEKVIVDSLVDDNLEGATEAAYEDGYSDGQEAVRETVAGEVHAAYEAGVLAATGAINGHLSDALKSMVSVPGYGEAN